MVVGAKRKPSLRGPIHLAVSDAECNTLISDAQKLIADLDDGFVRLGSVLLQLYAGLSAREFKLVVETRLEMKYRKALMLMDAADMVRDFGVPAKIYTKIGWSKLALVARHATNDNWSSLCRAAQRMNQVSLVAHLRAGGVADKVALTFSVSRTTAEEMRSLLIAHGASRDGLGRLRGCEGAIRNLLGRTDRSKVLRVTQGLAV